MGIDVSVVCSKPRQKGKMQDNQDKETNTDEIQNTREYKNPGVSEILPLKSRPALGPTKPPIKWVTGHFPGAKRPGRGVNHPPPSGARG